MSQNQFVVCSILLIYLASVRTYAQSSGVELLRHDLSIYPNGRLYPDTTLQGLEEGLAAFNQGCKAKSFESSDVYFSKEQAQVMLYQYYGLPAELEYVDSPHDTSGGLYMGMTYDSLVVTKSLAIFYGTNSYSSTEQTYFIELYTSEGKIARGRLFANPATYTYLSARFQSYKPSVYPIANSWRAPSIEVLVLDSLPRRSTLPPIYQRSIAYAQCLYDEQLDIFGLAGTYKIDVFSDSYYKRFEETIFKWHKRSNPKGKFQYLDYDKKLERYNKAIDSDPLVAQAYYLALGEAINGNLMLTTGVSIKPDYLFIQLVDQRENFKHGLRITQHSVSWPSCGWSGGIDGSMWYFRKPIAMLAGATGKTQLFLNAHFDLLKNQIRAYNPERPGFAIGGYLDETKALGLNAEALIIFQIVGPQKHKKFPFNELKYGLSFKLVDSEDRLSYLDILYNVIGDKNLDNHNRLRAFITARQMIKNMENIYLSTSEAENARLKIGELLPGWLKN